MFVLIKIRYFVNIILNAWIYCSKFGKCVSCDKHFDSSPPVLLPCGHIICREECFSIIVQTTDAEKLCPVNRCSQSIPENFDENETPEKQKYEILHLNQNADKVM